MLKERDASAVQSGAADEIHPETNAPRVLGEIRGAADADALLADEDRRIAERQTQSVAEEAQRIAAVDRLREVGRKAWERFYLPVPSPQRRVADTIEKAAQSVGPDANAAQLNHVANHIQGFERAAADFLTRGDNHGLESAITTLWLGIRDADKLATPKLPLMPAGDNVFGGWSSEEQLGLRTILVKGLGGVTVGDRCISVDAKEATLASGKRVSRAQALEAYIPPAGGKMIAVGSLSTVMNAIRARS